MGIIEDAVAANPHRYDGYKAVAQQESNPDVQTTFTAHRDSDGAGLGAYASVEALEAVMETDRRLQATKPVGLDWSPVPVAQQPAVPPAPETPPAA